MLRIGGVSGLIGNPQKPWRRTDDEYLEQLSRALQDGADLLVLHDGPDAPPFPFKGSPRIREWIELAPPQLVIRGHNHWAEPLIELDSGVQVLNVDSRIVILQRE